MCAKEPSFGELRKQKWREIVQMSHQIKDIWTVRMRNPELEQYVVKVYPFLRDHHVEWVSGGGSIELDENFLKVFGFYSLEGGDDPPDA